jgi:signal transduction histidine kinase
LNQAVFAPSPVAMPFTVESIGQLAAGMAHEINTPCQFVGDNLRFMVTAWNDLGDVFAICDQTRGAALTDGPIDFVRQLSQACEKADLAYVRDEVPRAAASCLDGLDRISVIVQAMKEFSHPGVNEMAALDLNRAGQTTLTVATNEWKYVADVSLDLQADLPAVTCLAGEISQVLLNLIVNAAHAVGDVVGDGSRGKGRIVVATRLSGDHVEIRVTDTGTGVPESARPHLFEPSFTTKDVGKGNGQGLALAYAVVVKRHGGEIWFDTEMGRGTSFHVRLPVNQLTRPDATRRLETDVV